MGEASAVRAAALSALRPARVDAQTPGSLRRHRSDAPLRRHDDRGPPSHGAPLFGGADDELRTGAQRRSRRLVREPQAARRRAGARRADRGAGRRDPLRHARTRATLSCAGAGEPLRGVGADLGGRGPAADGRRVSAALSPRGPEATRDGGRRPTNQLHAAPGAGRTRVERGGGDAPRSDGDRAGRKAAQATESGHAGMRGASRTRKP